MRFVALFIVCYFAVMTLGFILASLAIHGEVHW